MTDRIPPPWRPCAEERIFGTPEVYYYIQYQEPGQNRWCVLGGTSVTDEGEALGVLATLRRHQLGGFQYRAMKVAVQVVSEEEVPNGSH